MGEENGNPLQYSCLENPVIREAWRAAVHRVAKSDTSEAISMHACTGDGNGNPFHYSCLENLRHRGAWWAALYGVAQSQTRLKRLGSSSIHFNWSLAFYFLLKREGWYTIKHFSLNLITGVAL